MRGFITGSRAYGEPTNESDIDLVVMVDASARNLLRMLSDTPEATRGIVVVRFGKLNLILPEDEAELAVWKVGTEQLLRNKRENGNSTDKHTAKKAFDHLRDIVGIDDSY
jgi:predicted nucleotidyltransferase